MLYSSDFSVYVWLFDNFYDGKEKADTKITGYLQIILNPNDSFKKIYDTFEKHFDLKNIDKETKGGYGSRDFTIYVDQSDHKIHVYNKGKKSEK